MLAPFKANVVVLCAFKQGYSWLMDEIAPQLKGTHAASLKIAFKKNESEGGRVMFTPARWVQELYPVDEALANIIRHAYDGRPDQPIEVLCRRLLNRTGSEQRAGLEIVLVDHGAAPDRKKLCGRSLDDVRPGGLGIHFIEDAVDVMQYTSHARENRLRLVKYLPNAKRETKVVKGD